jgi:hypothetical protein
MSGGFADGSRARRVWLGALVTLVLAGLAGCAGSAHSATTPPRPSGTHSSPGRTATTPPAGLAGSGAQNLVASSTVKAALLAAFAAEKGLTTGELTGPLPGSLYYGVSGSTYWAIAHFGLTSSAPFQAQVDMQDGGNIGVFSRQGGQAWTTRIGGEPFPCPGELPADLMTVWGITSPGVCGVLTATSPAKAQATAANAVEVPAGTYFGTVLQENLQLDGSGNILFQPETWPGAASPSSQGQGFYLLDFGPSTVAGYWTGTSRSSSQEVLGRYDLAFARRVQSAMVPFMTQPDSGYEVTVSSPPGCSGACSEVAKIIQINSVAPLPANPDFTAPSQ